MKGMVTCKVCGRDFPLIAEEHYIARSVKTTPEISLKELWSPSPTEPVQYDAIDCPHCGCQMILQEREHTQWPCTEEGFCGVCDACSEGPEGENDNE